MNLCFRKINRQLGIVGLVIFIITSCSQKDDLPFIFYIENYSWTSTPVVSSTLSEDMVDTEVKIQLSITNVSNTPWTVSLVDVGVRPRVKKGGQWKFNDDESFWTVVDSSVFSQKNRQLEDFFSMREIQPSQTIMYYGILETSGVKRGYEYPLEKIRIHFTPLTQEDEKEDEDVMSVLRRWEEFSEGKDLLSTTYRQEILFDVSGLDKVGEILTQTVYQVR